MDELLTISLDGKLPVNLDEYEPIGFELSSEYWTPHSSGDFKKLVFIGFKVMAMPSRTKSGETEDVEHCIFAEIIDGEASQVTNASARLVSTIKNHNIRPGTPLQITYLGKKKNATNNNESDHWSIKPLSTQKTQKTF
jgi:hypothetical protein